MIKDYKAYNVRSAYRLCMNGLLDTNNFKVNGSWDLIWRLKIPPKAEEKKLCGEFVGIASQLTRLQDKGVNCPTNCIFRDSDNKDSLHIWDILVRLKGSL
jgi:hypothetical protein